MKKYIYGLLILFLVFAVFSPKSSRAETTLNGGVSLMDNLPQELFGSWVVASVQTYTNNKTLTAPPSLDYWNIYRSGNVLTLENPQTGAKASVTLDAVKQNTVTFTRTKKSQSEETTETPTITISGENFAGKDRMVVKKYKNNVLTNTDVVEFFISGRKVGGNAVSELLN